MYADDSTFLNSSNSVSVLESSTVNEMKKVIEWFHTNKMAVNIDKSNVMVFSPCLQPSPRVSITIENSNGIPVQISQIPNTDENSFKLLGFHIDERLTLRKQVDNICSKVNKSLFFLSRVKRTLPLYCRKQLYFSHVHSHFVYCLSLLSIANKTDIIKLERIQRKALRIVYNASFRADTIPFFHDLCTLPISDLIEREVLKTMHNVYSYNHPKEFAEYWSTNAFLHEYSLRYSIRFDLPLVKSIRLSQLPLFKFAQIYNNFPEDFKTIMERKEFVSKLEDFYGKQFKNESCNNLFCRMCSYESWLNHRNNYIVFPKTLNYIKY